jgi:hypothetical protein
MRSHRGDHVIADLDGLSPGLDLLADGGRDARLEIV